MEYKVDFAHGVASPQPHVKAYVYTPPVIITTTEKNKNYPCQICLFARFEAFCLESMYPFVRSDVRLIIRSLWPVWPT